MSFLDHVRHCNTHDLSDFAPWSIAGKRVGYLRAGLAARLAESPEVFAPGPAGLTLADTLKTPAARTDAVEGVLARLRADGLGGRRRLEPYAVAEHVGGPQLMTVDRGAASALGIISTGFHLNGFVGDGPDLKMWIARRSLDKPTFPGQLDNMVAGGQPATISVAENVPKECREEADIPENLARQARPTGLISYTMAMGDGLRRHAMYVYDLALPADFTPRPLDGEVDSFQLMPIAKVAEIVRASLDVFKFNCSLVVIDFLIRHGQIGPEHPEYFDLVTGLRGTIP
jgi:hypothetical protein